MKLTLHDLKSGDRIRVVDGAIAQIVQPTEDGRWILVRYVESANDPTLIGTEDLCSEDEVLEAVGHSIGD